MKKITLFIILLACITLVNGQLIKTGSSWSVVAAGGGSGSTLLDGLTAAFDLQETSVPIVDEVASLTSTGTTGSTAITYSVSGQHNNAMEFHYLPTYGGGQHIIVGNDLLLHGTITVSLWFYLTSTDNDAFCLIHNNNGGTENRGYYIFTGGVGGGVAARAYNSSGSYVETDSAPTWTVPAANTWYNLIFIADGTNLSIYVNGTLRTQDAFAYSIDYGSDSVLIIGGRDAANGWCFNGRIDEVYFWNRALTSDERTELQTGFYPFN